MPRPKRKKIKFDEESANQLLQEIYDESLNIRAEIRRLFTKWEAKVKEGGEVQAIGDQIIKLIGARAKNQDQKILLLKFLKEVAFENTKKSGSTEEEDVGAEISKERKSALIKMVEESTSEKKDSK